MTAQKTRRNFLKNTAFAAAVPMVMPGSVFGADGKKAPSEKITVGMIGVGRQACAYNLRQLINEPDCHIVALSDVDRWRLDVTQERLAKVYGKRWRGGKTFGKAARYPDFRDLLADKNIDAVMISTPDHWHIPMAVMAAQAGKDVSLEKPIARSIPEGRILVDAMKRHGRIFRMDSEFRSKTVFHRVCELVRNGRIGKLRKIEACVPHDTSPEPTNLKQTPPPKDLDYDLWQGPALENPYCISRVQHSQSYQRPGWMRVPEYADGMICNWGAHMIDIAQLANDTEQTCPTEVKCIYFERGKGIWNNITNFEVHYRYANGVEFVCKSEKPYIRFEGDEGWIRADYNGKISANPTSILSSKIGEDEIQLPLLSEKRDFLNCVKSRKPTLGNAEVAQRVSSTCLLGLIAMNVGTNVSLKYDPETERFTNSDKANEQLKLPEARSKWSYEKILKSS